MFASHPCTRYLPVCILALAVFYYTFTSNDLAVGFLSDDAVYLMQAELYSPWHSEKSLVVKLVQEDSVFPPLYPVLLAFIGADTGTPVLASNITVSCLLLLLLITGIWSWQESKSCTLAASVPVLLGLLPSTLLMAQGLWSEFLFMCLLYGALTCLNGKQTTARHWLLAALLIGLSSLTRSVGITIVAGFVLLLLLKRPQRSWIYMIISAVPFLCWTLIRNTATDHPGYLTELSYLFNSSLPQLLHIILNKFTVLVDAWFWLFTATETSNVFSHPSSFIAAILFIVALTGFTLQLKRLKADAICLPFYLTAILLWPYSDVYFVSRFLYPLLPLFLLYIWFGLQYFSNNRNRQKTIFTIWMLSIITIAFPSSQQFITRAYTDLGVDLNPYRRSRSWLLPATYEQALETTVRNKYIIETLPAITKHITEQECVYTLQTPMVMLYGKRIANVFPSIAGSDNGLLSDPGLCRFYLAMPGTDIAQSYPPYYPINYAIDNKNYEIIPFYANSNEKSDPVFFLIKRITP